MTVESNYAIAIARLTDLVRRKTKTNVDLHAGFFPRFGQVTPR